MITRKSFVSVLKMDHVLKCHEIFKTDFVRAEGCYVYDQADRPYLDLEAGIWCTALGHNHAQVRQAMHQQIDQVIHLGTRCTGPLAEEAACRVLETTGIQNGRCVFLCSGSEAVEFAVQSVRRITGRPLMLTFSDSYLAAFGSSGRKASEEWILFDWSDCARCPDAHACNEFCPRLQQLPFDHIGGFVLEPGSSSGAVRFPPEWLVSSIAHIIKNHGGWKVANEITTGIGRTGKWYGHQYYDFQPDIVAIGKGLGNGYPVSAVALSEEAARLLEASGLRYAQSHQNDPLGCAVAVAVLKAIREEGLVDRSLRVGTHFVQKLSDLQAGHPALKEVRGRGLMIALELDPGFAVAKEVCLKLLELGILVGYHPARNFLRVNPALIISENDLSSFINHLDYIL